MSEPWYTRAFTSDYLTVYSHRSEAQAASQVAAMQDCGLLPRSGLMLDAACGSGRHLRAMREAGLHAVGFDFSLDLLRAGALRGVAVRADMREVPFADATFDGVASLFTSFGYFDDAADDLRVLRGYARVIKPGGRLVLDHINPVVTLRDLQPLTVDRRDGLEIRQERRFEPATGRLTKHVICTRDGETRRWHESVRLFPPQVLDGLLREAGLTLLRRCGDLDGREWVESASPRQVVLCARP